MTSRPTSRSIERPFQPCQHGHDPDPPPPGETVIHHKRTTGIPSMSIIHRGDLPTSPYGVSRGPRPLTPHHVLKRHGQIRDGLRELLGLTPGEIEVVLRLLRFYVRYGDVYPKEATVTARPGCSKATFWRTIRKLRYNGLVGVVNRYVVRPHAQISNLYRLDRLVLIIAKYLSERTGWIWPDWIHPVLDMDWQHFWRWITLPASVFRLPRAPGGVSPAPPGGRPSAAAPR